jgi:hypothetical protein
MSAITAFAAVAFILADALIGRQSGIATPAARALAVTSFLALAASLAAWLGREIWLIILTSRWHISNGSNGLLS